MENYINFQTFHILICCPSLKFFCKSACTDPQQLSSDKNNDKNQERERERERELEGSSIYYNTTKIINEGLSQFDGSAIFPIPLVRIWSPSSIRRKQKKKRKRNEKKRIKQGIYIYIYNNLQTQ